MAQNHEKSNSRGSDFGPKNWPILPLMMSKEDWVKITIAIKKIVTSGENQFPFLNTISLYSSLIFGFQNIENVAIDLAPYFIKCLRWAFTI